MRGREKVQAAMAALSPGMAATSSIRQPFAALSVAESGETSSSVHVPHTRSTRNAGCSSGAQLGGSTTRSQSAS